MADPREAGITSRLTRRQFLGVTSASAIAALLDAACGPPVTATPTSTPRADLQPALTQEPPIKPPEPTAAPTIEPSPTPIPPSATSTETPRSLSTIRDYADNRGIEIGNLGTAPRLTNSTGHAENLKTYFNLVTSDYELLWNAATPSNRPFRPTSDRYDFGLGDQLAGFAQANGMAFQVHHLIDGREWLLPNWLKAKNDRAEIIDLLKDHIRTTVSHYAGRVSRGIEWSVINEFGTRHDGVRNWWVDKLGRDNLDWVEEAFKTAREADPNAKLLINDFDIEYGGAKADQVYNLVKYLKERNIPIDGVGLQYHLNGAEFVGDSLRWKIELTKQQIEKFKELGIDIYVTEFDVRMDTIPGDQAQQLKIQADIYQAHLEAFLTSGVKSIAYFGISDKDSFYNDTVINGVSLSHADATLFDRNYNPKPAYDAIIEVLSNQQN